MSESEAKPLRLTLTAEGDETILSHEALSFLEDIVARFSATRDSLLDARKERQRRIDDGETPCPLSDTADIRNGDWQVAPPPAVLRDRRVEITAPAERKMAILALNSAARVYMADFEDSLSPTWNNLISGQRALYDIARQNAELKDEARGKEYRLNPDHNCVLIVRPRGWHLPEKHVLYEGRPISGALFDFALFFFHNAKVLAQRERGPFFYLPKMEHWREAALWDDILSHAEKAMGLPVGTTKTTALIETLPAVFQMHEILHATKGRMVGLNCGRWDYIFSYIKTLRMHGDRVLPERKIVTMRQHLMNAYSTELVKTCHQRNAHAMGGMSAFIPIKSDPVANDKAFEKVREDKILEAGNGHDGTWVAHPRSDCRRRRSLQPTNAKSRPKACHSRHPPHARRLPWRTTGRRQSGRLQRQHSSIPALPCRLAGRNGSGPPVQHDGRRRHRRNRPRPAVAMGALSDPAE